MIIKKKYNFFPELTFIAFCLFAVFKYENIWTMEPIWVEVFALSVELLRELHLTNPIQLNAEEVLIWINASWLYMKARPLDLSLVLEAKGVFVKCKYCW